MSRYVFTGAKCICQSCPTATGIMTVENKVSGESHGGILDIKCEPEMHGMCNLPTNPAVASAMGVPQKCIPLWAAPAWTNTEYISNIKVLGKRPLLDTALRVCLYGGIVKIFSPACTKIFHNAAAPDFSHIHRIITTAKSKNKMNDAASETAMKAMGDIFTEQNMPVGDVSDMPDIVVKDEDGRIYDFTGDDDYQNTAKSAMKTVNITHEERKSILGENIYRASDFLCPEKCPDGVSCDLSASIPRSSVVPKKASKGTDLKKNMHKNNALSEYDNETIRIIKKMNNDKNNPYRDKVEFTAEYHHLIPGKQCFGKCTLLVELANRYGYDINNHKNGIPLPSFKIKNGASLSEEELQKLRTYIMDTTGRQLHKGGHSYKTSLSESQIGQSDYESSVTALLNKTEKYLLTKKRNLCRMKQSQEDFEKEAQKFQDMMDGISQYLRDSVTSFPSTQENTSRRENKNNLYISYASAEYDYNRNHQKKYGGT